MFDDRKCKFNQNWNNDKCRCEFKNLKEHFVCKNGYFWNPAICSCKNGKYTRIIGDSVVICDEIIEETKSTSTKTIQTKNVQTKSSIYLIKRQSKRKNFLPFHDIGKLKEISITNILQKWKVIKN